MLARVNEAHRGHIRRASVRVTATELAAAGATTTFAKTFGPIPPGAFMLGVILKRIVAVAGGSNTYALTIGDGTTANLILAAANGDIDGGTTTVGNSPDGVVVPNGGTFTATVTSVGGNLSATTAGEFEVTVFYVV
jgi:hypothetical protein